MSAVAQLPMQLALAQVGEVLQVGLPAGAAGVTVDRITTDSRDVQPGDLFVALPGARVDGHDFVAGAIAAGAVAALVARPVAGVTAPQLVVADPGAALLDLAAWWRRQQAIQVVAVTGSNGKTTVKEMVATILRAHAGAQGWDPDLAVLATAGNFNNHLGLPLTLLRLRATHRLAVLELGMNHAGELARLSRVALPDVALVNNVQRAHVGHLGSLAAVANAKGEIFEGLPPQGIAVVNGDDGQAERLRALAGARPVWHFSCRTPAEVGPLLETEPLAQGQRLRFQTRDQAGTLEEGTVQIGLPGTHTAANVLAAIAVTRALHIPLATACAALAGFRGPPGRLQPAAGRAGCLVIDDTYNANPDSVLAAIRVLASRPGRRLLVLGDLGELGEGAPAMLAEIGQAARGAGLDGLLGLGELVIHAAQAFGAGATVDTDADALLARLDSLLGPDLTVLVKGSRFMRMERIVQGLQA